jgi:hypothetical protein
MWLEKNNNKTARNGEPPAKYNTEEYHLSIKRLNPDFKHEFWNMARIQELFSIAPELEEFREFFNSVLEPHICKCDFARYMVLYVYGGLYIDLDFICLRPLKPLIQGREMLLVMDVIDQNNGFKGFLSPNHITIANGVIGSSVTQESKKFWLVFLRLIMSRFAPVARVMDLTGPAILGGYCLAHKYDISSKPHWYVPTCWILPPVIKLQYPVCSHDYTQNNKKDGAGAGAGAPWAGAGAHVNNNNSSKKMLHAHTDRINPQLGEKGPFLTTKGHDGSGWFAQRREITASFNYYMNTHNVGMWVVSILLILLLVSVIGNIVQWRKQHSVCKTRNNNNAGTNPDMMFTLRPPWT